MTQIDINKPAKSPVIISFDGTAASGKGTIAQFISNTLSIHYLNTGKIFRMIAFYYSQYPDENIRTVLNSFATKTLSITSSYLYSEHNSNIASQLAERKIVREFVMERQQQYIKNKKIVLIEGRDIGTHVFPNASLKFFFDALLQVRAERRFKQLHEIEKSITFCGVIKNLRIRDARDKNRSISPLLEPEDAIKIDTTFLTVQETLDIVTKKIKKILDL